jgi:hypothetical protein
METNDAAQGTEPGDACFFGPVRRAVDRDVFEEMGGVAPALLAMGGVRGSQRLVRRTSFQS